MKIFLVLILIFALSFSSVSALGAEEESETKEKQEFIIEREWLDEEEIERVTVRVSRGHGSWHYGYNYFWFKDISKLNSELDKSGLPVLDEEMLVRQWQYLLGWGSGLRVGWTNIEGSQTKTGDGGRRVDLLVGKKGVLLEYPLYSEGKIDFGIGAAMGLGRSELNLLFKRPENSLEALSMNLNQRFAFATPHVNFKISILSFVDLKIQGSYSLTASRDEWDVEGEKIQIERLNTDGWQVGIGLGVRF